MRRAILGFAVLAFVIGCGGGGLTTRDTSTGGGTLTSSGTTSTSTTGSTNGGTFAVIPSSTPGKLDVNVLTGFGRSATVFVDISQVSFSRPSGGPLTSTFAAKRIGLDGYTHDLITASTAISPGTQTFNAFNFRIDKLILPGGIEINGPVVTSAPLSARTSRGRTVAFRLLLDDGMVYENNGSIVVDAGLFAMGNTDPFNGTLACFYSDFVRMDISGVAQRPSLATGGFAKYLYMSGDLFGLSSDAPASFEAFFGVNRSLDTVVQRSGAFVASGSSGTYELNEMDPNDPQAVIKRLEGTWTDVGNVVENIGTFAMIVFPSSDPQENDHILMISVGAGGISECYVGELNTGDSTFVAYPVSELGSQTPSFIGGAISDAPTGGTFTIEFGSKPSTFPDNGSYVRFIR